MAIKNKKTSPRDKLSPELRAIADGYDIIKFLEYNGVTEKEMLAALNSATKMIEDYIAKHNKVPL